MMSNKLFDPIYIDGVESQIDMLQSFLSGRHLSEADVYRELKMSRQTWKRRIASKDFTIKEMSHIVRIINKKMKWDRRS